MDKQLTLTTIKDGWYNHRMFDTFLHSFSSSYTIKGYSKPTEDILDVELPSSINAKVIKYAWLVDHYLITLLEESNTITIKAFIKVEDNCSQSELSSKVIWLASNLNNAGFLEQIWSSMWTNVRLGEYWHKIQDEEEGSCNWDLTDTPITLSKLSKALYEFTDWVTELNKDREAGEWEEVI